ncbi:MAG: hypothetical protein CL555_06045 [Algoriphagus sp.]|nr:hypothetical protein [Algoriphagus sp.]QDP64479.1 MAG: hypothetical protein Tp156MES38741_70 [Prokaryotic dsDNA virus sp.]
MANLDLAAMTRRAKNPRRTIIPMRAIKAQATQATNLWQSAYRPVVQAWEAALPAILAEYDRTLAQMTTDSPADVEARIGQAEAEAQSIVLRVSIALERWAAAVERWHRRRWVANVLSATSVDLSTMIGAPDMRMTLEAAIARNTGLIKSVSDETRRRVGDAVFRGLQNRTPSRDVARQLREAVGIERRRALRIASDQLSKLAGALNSERRRQSGISEFRWVHSGKLHPREDHLSRDGKLYTENPERVGKEYQGKTIRKAPDDRASQLPFCGCTEAAVLILE